MATPLHQGPPPVMHKGIYSCSPTCSYCGPEMYSIPDIETPSTVTMGKMNEMEYKLANDVLLEEGNATPRSRKNWLLRTISHMWTNLGVIISQRMQDSFSSKTNDPYQPNDSLSITIMDDENIASELFENSLTEQLISKSYFHTLEKEKSSKIIEVYNDIFPPMKSFMVDSFSTSPKKVYPNDLDSDDPVHCVNNDMRENLENFMRDNVHSNVMPCPEVQHGMTDRFYHEKPEASPDESELISLKQSYLYLKRSKQRKKAHGVVIGRDRRRARSQLRRRSRVSRTKRRKGHTKRHPPVNIRDDHENWQDDGLWHDLSSNDFDSDSSNLNHVDEHDFTDAIAAKFSELKIDSVISSESSDVTSKTEKPKVANNDEIEQKMTKLSLNRMHYVSDSSMDDESNEAYDLLKSNSFRPRLVSESSTNSDDSFRIVFEDEPDTDNNTEVADSDETISSEDEDDDTTHEKLVQKVKFNLIPTVHTMVKWNYAYRAARQGPWEEMARDRDRFKQRINCIATVLNPILTNQHRYNVWEKRFAPQISVSDYV